MNNMLSYMFGPRVSTGCSTNIPSTETHCNDYFSIISSGDHTVMWSLYLNTNKYY